MKREPVETAYDNLKRQLRESHDVLVAAERAIVTMLRLAKDSELKARRYRRLLKAGSCVACGGETFQGRTRCTPCGKKNSAVTRKRAAPRQGTEQGEKR